MLLVFLLFLLVSMSSPSSPSSAKSPPPTGPLHLTRHELNDRSVMWPVAGGSMVHGPTQIRTVSSIDPLTYELAQTLPCIAPSTPAPSDTDTDGPMPRTDQCLALTDTDGPMPRTDGPMPRTDESGSESTDSSSLGRVSDTTDPEMPSLASQVTEERQERLIQLEYSGVSMEERQERILHGRWRFNEYYQGSSSGSDTFTHTANSETLSELSSLSSLSDSASESDRSIPHAIPVQP